MSRGGFRSRRHPFVMERYRNETQSRLSLCQSHNLANEDEPEWCCGFEAHAEQRLQRERQRNDGSTCSSSEMMNYSREIFAAEKITRARSLETKRRIRPKSYAEPSHRNELTQGIVGYFGNGVLCSKNGAVGNGNVSNGGDSCVNFDIPRGKTTYYNGVAICDLEARLSVLRSQQLQKRRSIANFAISCLEPNPTAYEVEELEQGSSQDRLGIYIKSVVKGGSADKDGRLAAGDQLLSVDGQSLVGITQERAAEYLVRTGPIVSLEVAKEAAIYEGLATMLSQPSPVLSRDLEVCEDKEWNRSWRGSSELPSPRADDTWAFGGGIGYLRSAQSEGCLSRIKSLEALSRRGLSDSAIGVPRVIGSSRLLKFFLPSQRHNLEKDLSPSRYSREFRSQSLTTTPWGLAAPRRMSERDLPSKVLREQNLDVTEGGFHHGHPLNQSRIQASKSVPALNSDGTVGAGVTGSGVAMGNGQLVQPVDPMRTAQDPISMSGTRYQRQYPAVNSMTMPAQRQIDPAQQHHSALRSRSIQSLTDPVHRLDIGTKQPSTPALYLHPEEDRFYQNLAYYAAPPPPMNPANMPVRTYIPNSYSTGNIPTNPSSLGLRNPLHSNLGRVPAPNPNTSMSQQQIFQQHQQQQWQRSQQLHQNHPAQINQNLLRQEAKMLEMQDELRRREERATLMMHKAQQGYPDRINQRFSTPPSRYLPPQQQRLSNVGQSAAPAPKPYHHGMDMQEQPPGRPPLPVEYRHATEETPRNSQNFSNKNLQALNSPWEREEKERELQRRIEAAKYWRDQQINELELLGSNRNSAQEEQLKSLKMEREFQRRAEELNRRDEEYEGADGDPDDDEEDERKAMVKRIQEDLEKTRLHNQTASGVNGLSKEDDRARKLEEIRRKKIELEATQAAEERLVREAQKRREQEELKRKSQQTHQPLITSYQHQPQQYRSSFPPKLASPTTTFGSQEAPPLPKSPPPALSRSHGSMSPQKSPVSPPQSSPTRQKSDKKTVSFNETVDTNEPSSPSPVETERVREDPNLFLSEATAMLSSPRSPDDANGGGVGNTPGVIGAQEVYRDPRWRRLEEQQQQKLATPKPEKLTFQEKMKMFAVSSGEAHTPKDKVKTSRAQREIEIPGTPLTNNNNESD